MHSASRAPDRNHRPAVRHAPRGLGPGLISRWHRSTCILGGMRVRRRTPCYLEIADAVVPDFARLLRGEVHLDRSSEIRLLCPVSGQAIPATEREVALMATMAPGQWYDAADLACVAQLPVDAILAMAQRGLIVGDGDEPLSARLREGERTLEAVGWHPQAALYHATSAWEGVVGDEGRRRHDDEAHRERLDAHRARHGPIAPHFWRREDAHQRVALPLQHFDDALASLMRSRLTTRHFRSDVPLGLEDFTRVLFGTFGALGSETLAPGTVALKRTSPSGGGLHPIEAYPLVIDVEGLSPGFHHYEASSHSMALLDPMSRAQARELAEQLTIGQTYFAQAHALVFHVARLDRHHWKYRNHPKAYKAVLLDSGHLSQTFYLLATERRLGAFYTAAINDLDVAERLGLRPQVEIAIGASGIGVPDTACDQLHLKPEPYVPVAPVIPDQ
ncbi:putative peptide maturation dehydrogenase [Lysobacter sp. LF1]|uniref:Peptide maturation dehydrogenase n=1 Tax=Lysobacter stagni TaxID=3045172 RepID=A0ABT6XCP3_9GAMM|nr:putative peptide maturation dehydrogenase [Lysobacter sp. LF1]MDI9237915.1 putative peptide maturation dehydrogenase [Lysobacter sp. LF1]